MRSHIFTYFHKMPTTVHIYGHTFPVDKTKPKNEEVMMKTVKLTTWIVLTGLMLNINQAFAQSEYLQAGN